MVPEKLINEFVERIRAAAGTNLVAAILYGSAAAGDYNADHSDVNLLCVLGETSFAAIEALVPSIAWWVKQKHREPLLMSARRCEGRRMCSPSNFWTCGALSRAVGRRCSEDAGHSDAMASGTTGV